MLGIFRVHLVIDLRDIGCIRIRSGRKSTMEPLMVALSPDSKTVVASGIPAFGRDNVVHPFRNAEDFHGMIGDNAIEFSQKMFCDIIQRFIQTNRWFLPRRFDAEFLTNQVLATVEYRAITDAMESIHVSPVVFRSSDRGECEPLGPRKLSFINEYQRQRYEECRKALSQQSKEDLSLEAKMAQYLSMKERKEFPSRKGE